MLFASSTTTFSSHGWYSAYKAVQLFSAAYLFKPMPEFMAISTCDVSGLDSLYIQRQLSDRTGEMLAFVLSKGSWNEPSKRSRVEEMLRIRAEMSPEPLAWRVAMEGLAYLGSLEGVQCLYTLSPIKYGSKPADIAAANGKLSILKWLLTTTRDFASSDAMDQAATNGHMEVVQYLHEKSAVGATNQAMDGAAANGHLEIVRFLHEHRQEGCSTDAADLAASNGHFEIVKFLIDHRKEGYSTKAMDGAASQGHLDIVRFLHGRNTSSPQNASIKQSLKRLFLSPSIPVGCTKYALEDAAANGHLNVVRFLREHRQEGCIKDALEHATANGHLNVVHFLATHHPECISKICLGLHTAGKRGHLDVVKFFLASTVQPAPFNWFGMMQNACTEGHVDMVGALWDHRRDCRSHGDLNLLRAAERGHVQVVRFFVEQNKIKHVEDAMFSAALDGHLETVKYLVELNYVTQVQHAVEGAAHYGHLEVVKYLVQRQFEIHLEPVFVAAAKRGHLDIVRYCDCHCKLKSREALVQAAMNGHWISTLAHRHAHHGVPTHETPRNLSVRLQAMSHYLESISISST
ncbi:hypothetical protein AeNC1_008256 [Aphanomyces euteiches]|nr:hypothetical protein AeNC1_008256 [Aphanomyces euteiches]